MKGVLLTVAFALLAGPLSPAVRAQGEFPLEEKEIKGPPPPVAMFADQFLRAEREKPAQVKALPEISGQASYCVAQFGGRNVLLVLDMADKPKLYVDTDQDGDLSDEEPFVGAVQMQARGLLEALAEALVMGGPDRQVRFGPIALRMTDPEIELKVNIEVNAAGPGVNYLMVHPGSYRSGKVELAGRSYRVELVDATFDGRYDEAFSPRRGLSCDWLAIDLDGDNSFDRRLFRSAEIVPLPKLVRVEDAYYSVEVRPDGSTIRLEEVQPRFGTLDVGTTDAKLSLLSESGFHSLKGGEPSWRLPAGGYMAMEIVLNRKDEDGVEWQLKSSGQTGRLENFQILDGETHAVKVGPPVEGITTVYSQPGVANIAFSLRGQAREEYAAGADRNGRRQPAPKFKILSESGEVLASGAFEYG